MTQVAERSPKRGGRRGTNGTKHEAHVPLDWIQTPPQIRRTIDPDYIARLAASIVSTGGCENPPIVYQFTPDAFGAYLCQVRDIWGYDCNMQDYSRYVYGDAEYYFVVVAGACRTRALRMIRDEGCSACSEEHGKEEIYACFERHFHGREITVRLDTSNDPDQGLRDMFAENTYQAPSPAESALGLGLYFMWASRQTSGLTMAAFSRMVGYSPAKIAESIRYLELPDYIKDAVERKGFPYGLAIQLTRLARAGVTERQLEDWYIKMVTADRRKTVKTWDEEVTKVLRSMRQSQSSLDLGEAMMAAMESEARKSARRKPVLEGVLLGLYDQMRWLDEVLRLFEQGLLGPSDSPYTRDSVLNGLRVIAEMSKAATNHMRWLGEKERGEFGEVNSELVAQVERLLQRLACGVERGGKEP